MQASAFCVYLVTMRSAQASSRWKCWTQYAKTLHKLKGLGFGTKNKFPELDAAEAFVKQRTRDEDASRS